MHVIIYTILLWLWTVSRHSGLGLHCAPVFFFRAIFSPRLFPAALCLPAWQVRACLDPVDEMQKMAELLGLRDECGEGTLGAPALAGSCLADNRLNLDVYPDGCRRFLQLFKEQQGEVVQVEFLRLSSNDCLLETTLDSLPHLKHLKSLVLKGKFRGLSPSSFPRLSFLLILLSTSAGQIALGSVLFQCSSPQLWLSLAQSWMQISTRYSFWTLISSLYFYSYLGTGFLESSWVDAATFSIAFSRRRAFCSVMQEERDWKVLNLLVNAQPLFHFWDYSKLSLLCFYLNQSMLDPCLLSVTVGLTKFKTDQKRLFNILSKVGHRVCMKFGKV